jgi:hypothetical protein
VELALGQTLHNSGRVTTATEDHRRRSSRTGARETQKASISAEPTRGLDSLKIDKVQLTDRLQCLSGGAILQTTRQRLKPGNILTLQHGQLGDRVPPTLGTAALVDCPARAHDRHTGNSRGAATGLTLGVGHRPVTDRLARHGSIPKRDVTKYRAHKTNAPARSFNRQI